MTLKIWSILRRTSINNTIRRYSASGPNNCNSNNTTANNYTTRTHTCGELRADHVGQRVKICGWLKYKRLPKFLVVGDVYGSVQVYANSKDKNVQNRLHDLNVESVVEIDGLVAHRPPKDKNANMPTGQIEIHLSDLKIHSQSKSPLPVDVNEHVTPNEYLRLRHRYLDLRRPCVQHMLRFRASLIHKMRNFLVSRQFVEIETPTLFRRTPGGAAEFVVPASTVPGHFYSLPQSPQQFKQLLMVGGEDRYFQVARCYRDEGSKPDRQPEFTQLDIELSFTDQEKVIKLIEDVIKASWPDAHSDKYGLPSFDHMTYAECMRRYGTDKPDLRFLWEIKPLRSYLLPTGNGLDNTVSVNNHPYYVLAPKLGQVLNDEILSNWRHNLAENYKAFATNFYCYKVVGQDRQLILLGQGFSFKDDDPIELDELKDIPGIEENDVIFVSPNLSGHKNEHDIFKTLGKLRIWAADCIEQAFEGEGVKVREDAYKFLWVNDFPLFLKNEVTDTWESAHHPFTAPLGETLESMKSKNPADLIAQHYDLVLNGTELGGGSIRVHDVDMQTYILQDILQENCTEMQHLLEAFKYGAPPHGGFAIGLDRYIALLLKAKSIRDVIAFPKSTDGRDLMTKAPATVSNEILERYHVSLNLPPAADEPDETAESVKSENILEKERLSVN